MQSPGAFRNVLAPFMGMASSRKTTTVTTTTATTTTTAMIIITGGAVDLLDLVLMEFMLSGT